MCRKHFKKYFQKYYLFLCSTTLVIFLYACSTTKKVPNGEFLLTKNNFKFDDGKLYASQIPNYVSQKPNKKDLFFLPLGLWMYNVANPKYDSILTEYMTYPGTVRNQKLRDSLFIKYNHPEYVGKSIFWSRFCHTIGQPPVILDQSRTETSANNIRKFFVYRGYWDAKVKYSQKLDSASKKAEVNYLITHKDPTFIKDYFYNIPDQNIRSIYESQINKSLVKKGNILDQTQLEKEVKRINDLMKENGYYRFNDSNEEIYFTADSLKSRKQVPLTMDIHKDSADSHYKKTTIGSVKMYVLEKLSDTATVKKDSLRGVAFFKFDNQYKTRALWRPITIENGEIYNQKNLDLTKRNILAMNNFSFLRSNKEKLRPYPNDSILDVSYYLKPLPTYEFKVATDVNYSQILNFGVSPSVNLTSRNIFGGAENLTTSISGIFGSVKDPQYDGKRNLAYEISAQASLNFPKLLLPFKYHKLIKRKYSPTSSIVLGASVQNNIGMGRINFNGSLNYFANVNDVVSHRLSLFNTQLSFTQNKDKYYDFFKGDDAIRSEIFSKYQTFNPSYNQSNYSYDEVSSTIVSDPAFIASLDADGQNLLNKFLQSLINKDRQTQDVLISSLIYNFSYNEIGKKDYENPFYFNGKVELAGNLFSLFKPREIKDGVVSDAQRTIFKIPYSQFVKLDFDVRKYFTFFKDSPNKHTLVIRQLIGLGIPYGNSEYMPYVRSYFNGGSNDIRAWLAFGGLGPADSQLDERVRAYITDNMKLTTNIEYRIPFNSRYEGAIFTDAGNIWSLKSDGFGDEFKFNKFLSQMGVGSGIGLRINIAYITLRLDLAYKIYDPNQPNGEKWRLNKFQPFKPTLNFAFGYPF